MDKKHKKENKEEKKEEKKVGKKEKTKGNKPGRKKKKKGEMKEKDSKEFRKRLILNGKWENGRPQRMYVRKKREKDERK